MQNISKNEIQQAFGVMKTILILVLYAIFIISGYILIDRTDINTIFVMGIISIIGIVEIGIAFLGLKILEKIKLYLEGKEKVPKEVQEANETVNIAKEPKKKLKLPKLPKLKKPKTEYLGTPLDEIEEAVNDTITASVQETIEKTLPIEEESKKLPIEE